MASNALLMSILGRGEYNPDTQSEGKTGGIGHQPYFFKYPAALVQEGPFFVDKMLHVKFIYLYCYKK